MKNEVALRYHRVRGLYFLAVVFAVTNTINTKLKYTTIITGIDVSYFIFIVINLGDLFFIF